MRCKRDLKERNDMFASLRIRTALVLGLSLGAPAIASAATVTLAWNANPESNIGGYVLVYGTTPGSYSGSVDVGNTTTRAISSLTAGTRYYFAVRAYNTSDVSGPLSIEVNEIAADPADVTPPVATMTGPAAGAQVSGSVQLSATATDNVAVAGITFRVDGIAAGAEDTTAPYTFTWNTVSAANGSHALTAVARDTAGNLGTSAAITVQVQNDQTPPTILTLTPAANASGVSAATAVSVRFNEALTPSSVSAATFELRTVTTNTLVAAAVSYDAATNTARLVPGAPLAAGASFNATIKGGSTGVRDVAGNALAANTLWSFTVGQPPPPGVGLVAAYAFEEGAGTVTADASGRGNNGTISGAAWRPGRFGNSLGFDGLNDWVTVADSTSLALDQGMTLEAWVYPTAPGGWRTVLIKEWPDWYTFALYSGGPVGPGVRAMAVSDGNATIPTALPINAWSHLAATYDGATLRFFVNGAAVAGTSVHGKLVDVDRPAANRWQQ